MARVIKAGKPTDKLCQTCDSKVNYDRSTRSYVHVSRSKENDHPALKVHTYAEQQEKLNKARGWIKKSGVWVNPNQKPEKPSKGTAPRQSQADRAKAAEEREAARAARRAERENNKFLKKEYYHPTKGFHFPLSTSKQAVADPERGGQLFVPATGEYKDSYLEVPPKKDSAEGQKIDAALDHVASHPGHRWEEVTDTSDTTGQKRHVSSFGMLSAAINAGRKLVSRRDYQQGITNWAHHVKAEQDPNDEYEYAVVRPTIPSDGDFRNVPYGKNFSYKTKGQDWFAFRRKRHCAQCAPTVTDDSGNQVPNPSRTIDRSSVPEWGLQRRTNFNTENDVDYWRNQEGFGPTKSPTKGIQPWKRAIKTPKDHFETGTGEGRL